MSGTASKSSKVRLSGFFFKYGIYVPEIGILIDHGNYGSKPSIYLCDFPS